MQIAFGRVRRKTAPTGPGSSKSSERTENRIALTPNQGCLILGFLAILEKESRFRDRPYHDMSGFGNPSYRRTMVKYTITYTPEDWRG